MRFIKATYHLASKTVEYEAGDGTRLLKNGGSLNWRFNNPGNIMALPDASTQKGRIGSGTVFNPSKNTFAIFSSIEAGEREKCALLKRKYKDKTTLEMMKIYAPEEAGNDPVAYAKFITSESGVSDSKKISDLNDDEFSKVAEAISKKEGGLKPGIEKWVYVTNVTISDGSRPVADIPFKVMLGRTTYEWKTDSYGKLKTIIHTQLGIDIVIKYANPSGKEDIVYSAIAGDTTKNILLTRNFSHFRAKTLANEPKIPREKSIQKPIDYVVMSGDTLSKIAERYKTSTDELAKNNNIKDVSKIFPGQCLTIFGVSTNDSITYQVAPGDTLEKIAERNGMTVDNLARQNNITDPNKIYPGQSISITHEVSDSKAGSKVAEYSEHKTLPANPLATNTSPAMKVLINVDKRDLESVGAKKSGNPIAVIPHDQRETPWMVIAIREAEKWKGANETIITKTSNYHKLIGHEKLLPSLTGSKYAWCASFVNYCLEETGYPKSKFPYRARSFIDDSRNFFEITKPIYGAIATSGHHTTFVYGINKKDDALICLGGNQGGDSIINGTLSSGTIKFSVYNRMRYYLPVSYKGSYDSKVKSDLPKYDVDELNINILGIVVKSKGKESTR